MIGIPEPAARLYAVALALDKAAEDPRPGRDVEGLISTGLLMAKHVSDHPDRVPVGMDTLYFRDAASAFCRAVAKHRPGSAADWIEAAELCELGRWGSFHPRAA